MQLNGEPGAELRYPVELELTAANGALLLVGAPKLRQCPAINPSPAHAAVPWTSHHSSSQLDWARLNSSSLDGNGVDVETLTLSARTHII